MPTYEHLCENCKYEWEFFYSIKDEPPTVCPNCEKEGCVKRLISGGSGKGIVTLTGNDLKEKIKSDANDTIRQAGRNEKLLANLVGEDKYHRNETERSKRRR